MQSLTLIYVEKLGKRIGQKLHLSIKSELLKLLACLRRRLHNIGAEFVDQTNKAFIFDFKLVTNCNAYCFVLFSVIPRVPNLPMFDINQDI